MNLDNFSFQTVAGFFSEAFNFMHLECSVSVLTALSVTFIMSGIFMAARLWNLSRKNQELVARITSDGDKICVMKSQLRAKDGNVRQLREVLRVQEAALQNRADEMRSISEQEQRRDAEIDDHIKMIRKLLEEICVLKDNLQKKEAEIGENKKTIQELQVSLINRNEKSDAQNKGHERLIAGLQEENRSLKDKVQILQSEKETESTRSWFWR